MIFKGYSLSLSHAKRKIINLIIFQKIICIFVLIKPATVFSMDRIITYQKWKKVYEDKYALAFAYYSLLSSLNSLSLTERELQLLAFTAVKGNISYANVRDEFCRRYNTTSPTINNMISKLKKLHIFMKENGKIRVNPKLVINFDNDLTIEIKLQHDEDTSV